VKQLQVLRLLHLRHGLVLYIEIYSNDDERLMILNVTSMTSTIMIDLKSMGSLTLAVRMMFLGGGISVVKTSLDYLVVLEDGEQDN
jgi:hypothetical protein